MPLYKRKKKGKDGQLYELKKWYYQFWIKGKRFKGCTGTENEKQAEAIERRARVAAEDGDDPRPQKAPVLRDLIADFSKWVETINKAPKTKIDYQTGCRLILATPLAGMRADRITEDDLEATKFHDSPYSTNCALRTLRRAMRRAQRKKDLKDLPKFKLMDAPRREVTVSDENEDRLLKAIKFAADNRRYKKRPPSPLGDVFSIMMDSGMRDGEVVRMEIQNIHWDACYYRNPKGKTPKARRIVPLSERVIAILRARCGDRKEGWVFPSKKSPSGHVELGGLQKHFRAIARSLGLQEELKLYCSRHTFGTVAMAETRDPALVRDTMGHEDLRTTMEYMHPEVERIKAVIDRRNQAKELKFGKAVDLAAMPVQPGVN